MSKETPKPGPWSASLATYDKGKAIIDGADQACVEASAKWGEGRLRLLVDDDLRARFDSQWRKFNEAIREGDLETVMREASRMRAAWLALDKAATALGASPLSPNVWEAVDDDGVTIAIVRTSSEAGHVISEGRVMRVFTVDEIARLLRAHYANVSEAKEAFPGATVTQTRKPEAGFHQAGAMNWGKGDQMPF